MLTYVPGSWQIFGGPLLCLPHKAPLLAGFSWQQLSAVGDLLPRLLNHNYRLHLRKRATLPGVSSLG